MRDHFPRFNDADLPTERGSDKYRNSGCRGRKLVLRYRLTSTFRDAVCEFGLQYAVGILPSTRACDCSMMKAGRRPTWRATPSVSSQRWRLLRGSFNERRTWCYNACLWRASIQSGVGGACVLAGGRRVPGWRHRGRSTSRGLVAARPRPARPIG